MCLDLFLQCLQSFDMSQSEYFCLTFKNALLY